MDLIHAQCRREEVGYAIKIIIKVAFKVFNRSARSCFGFVNLSEYDVSDEAGLYGQSMSLPLFISISVFFYISGLL